MAGTTIVWTGIASLDARMKEAQVKAISETARALYIIGRKVMNKSVHLCPKDTGFLRGTAHVAPPVIEGQSVLVQLSYGAEYAIYVHEILDAVHPIGQAKYLETPVLEAQSTLAADMSALLQGRIL